MLTITDNEHDKMVASAEATLVVKAKEALCDLKAGRDISEVYVNVNTPQCNLESLKRFKTGKFDPSEYYNNVSPVMVSGMYSNINTLDE